MESFCTDFNGLTRVNSLRQRFSGHPPEQRQHAHISRRNRRRARHQQDDHQHQNGELQYSLSGATQVNPRQSFTAQIKPCRSWHFPLRLAAHPRKLWARTTLNPLIRNQHPLDFPCRTRARRLLRLGLTSYNVTSHDSPDHCCPVTLPHILYPFLLTTTGMLTSESAPSRPLFPRVPNECGSRSLRHAVFFRLERGEEIGRQGGELRTFSIAATKRSKVVRVAQESA